MTDEVYIVLDDDPTGTQTVHDTVVLTCRDDETLYGEIIRGKHFFILTDSRALSGPETASLHRELAGALQRTAIASGKKIKLISRSDSTLRGHYPLETDILCSVFDEYRGVLLCPYFEEGGRYTLGGIHYVKESEKLTPAADTEFACDLTFGYTKSRMTDYVVEKTGGRLTGDDIEYLSLDDIHTSSAAKKLAKGKKAVVCDCVCMTDAQMLVRAWKTAAEKGVLYLPRCAASFVKAAFGQTGERPFLSFHTKKAGLVVAGSYTERTTKQLERLRGFDADFTEFDVNADLPSETVRVNAFINDTLACGRHCVVYTSRILKRVGDPVGQLDFSRKIARALADAVAGLRTKPGFVLAKGGITSSETAVRGLRIKRALVAGQLLPGVPVWIPDGSDIPYIIFPGNVGSEDSLLDAFHKMTRR